MQREVRKNKPLFDRLKAEERKCDPLRLRTRLADIPEERELQWQRIRAEGNEIGPGFLSLFSYGPTPEKRCRDKVNDAIVKADDAEHARLRRLMVARLNADLPTKFGPYSLGIATTFIDGPLHGLTAWASLWRMQRGGMPLD